MLDPNSHTLTPSEYEEGQRLDLFLAKRIDLSRNKVQNLLANGLLVCRGSIVNNPNKKVRCSETYVLNIPFNFFKDRLIPKQDSLNILFEDEDLLVIDKPSNLTVHPGAGNHQDTLVNILLGYLGESFIQVGEKERPGIIHRLDKDTSGVMVVAKNNISHEVLSRNIKHREIKRQYVALVWRKMTKLSGSIENNIGRNNSDRKKMSVVINSGKSSLTHYKVLKHFLDLATLVQCDLATGRTHQIRVHMAHIGHPLVGDQVYFDRQILRKEYPAELNFLTQFPRQALHSHYIEFVHPRHSTLMSFQAPVPKDLSKIISNLDSL